MQINGQGSGAPLEACPPPFLHVMPLAPGGRPKPPPGAPTLVRRRIWQRTLSALVVDDFHVDILPSADHWWTFSNTDDLGRALAEAGHLVIGYGMPWLAGELEPPSG